MKRFVVIALALAAILFVVWQLSERPGPAPQSAVRQPGVADTRSTSPGISSAAPEERSTLADALNAAGGDIRADLRIVDELITTFRTNFPHDGNPVGDNAEITATLTGKNRLQLVLISPNHPAINRDGELCDRWGTPFFFHAESGTRMEIRSAGPDKKMHTEDDVVFAP